MNRQAFPSRAPLGVLFGLLLALVAGLCFLAHFRASQDAVQSFYFWSYASPFSSGKPQKFVLLTSGPTRGNPSQTCLSSTPFLVASHVEAQGIETAGRCTVTTTAAEMKSWLRQTVYGGQPVTELVRGPLTVWMFLALSLLIVGGLYDGHRRTRARIGIQLRGPELVSRWQFNRKIKGDGFPILLENRCNLLERMQGKSGKVLRIRLRDENKNLICMSDPGGGKTSILMQILDEVERRG